LRRSVHAELAPRRVGDAAEGFHKSFHSIVLRERFASSAGQVPRATTRATRYPVGTGFIDAGGGHVHMVRNEGKERLVTEAFQIVPARDSRRIDAANPGNCGF
jgi:hypothetical protein